MYLLMSVLILMLAPCGKCSKAGTVGSILFFKHRIDTDCWHPDDVARLRARSVFENISLPVLVPPEKIDTKYVSDSVNYFRRAIRLAENAKGHNTAVILKEAVADSIGGHLQSEILPSIRLAYYAGYIPYRSVRHIHNFFEEIKRMLNTQGLGWRRPPRIPVKSTVAVKKIIITKGKLINPCATLIMKRDEKGCIHLPHPKFDEGNDPSAIALPFKSGGLVSLTSPKAESIILKYYTTASRCILNNSPENCRHTDFVSFNKDIWRWLKRDVAPHLTDDKLYAAYGGVLRVASAVQSYGNGLSRRNLYDYEFNTDDQPRWNPWRILTQSHVVSKLSWTPQLYIGVTVAAALLILLLQMSYNYIFRSGCCCCDTNVTRTSRMSRDEERPLLGDQVSFAETSSRFPCVVPQSSRASAPRSLKGTSPPTQRVYDFNENAEKMMSVIMSDYEGSAPSVVTTTTISESDIAGHKRSAPTTARTSRTRLTTSGISTRGRSKPSSPPKIPAPIAELKLKRSVRSLASGIPMYSTSTISRSEVTYRTKGPGVRKSVYTCTGSTTSVGSASSASSQTPTQSHTQSTRMSKRCRDIAWARRVISQTTRRDATTKSHSTTGTEVDLNSFMTPPSKR